MLKKFLKYIVLLVLAFFIFFVYNAIRVYNFSFQHIDSASDVAIVLGAGTANAQVSPVFKERLNHAAKLYTENKIKFIITTGGKGENQTIADSEVAKAYLIQMGIPADRIYTDTLSRYTHENIAEAQQIMTKLKANKALLVSDPLHMKRAMFLSHKASLNCSSSPTQTSRYKSFGPKFKSLCYESFFLTLNYFKYGF